MEVTRSEHMKWCKERALEELDNGNVKECFMSMVSDLRKHPETDGHIAISLGMMQMMNGHLDAPNAMRDFINGFN